MSMHMADGSKPSKMHDEKTQEAYLLFALEASKLTPEEFGETLAAATAPVNLDNAKDRAIRASARGFIVGLPNGMAILAYEERQVTG